MDVTGEEESADGEMGVEGRKGRTWTFDVDGGAYIKSVVESKPRCLPKPASGISSGGGALNISNWTSQIIRAIRKTTGSSSWMVSSPIVAVEVPQWENERKRKNGRKTKVCCEALLHL